MRFWSYVVSAFLIVLVGASPVFADFYSYTDDSGVVHITNVPTSAGYKLIMKERKNPTRKSSANAEIDDIIERASMKYGVDPTLVRAIVKTESNFDSGAVSEDGARGLMQLMPETARLMGVRDIDDPEENLEGGVRYLSQLLKTFGSNLQLAVAAYNAGETAVRKYGAIPPYRETRDYVKKVLHYYDVYGGRVEAEGRGY